MKKYGKKGFTLIELIAVLVIMAIIALIATPLVMSIIRKARVSADKRSIDAYGRSIELAIAGYLLDTGKFPTEVSQLTIEYSGNQVVCETTQINTDSSVYLTGCTVAGRSVDYTYGKLEVITYDAYEIGDEVTYNGVNYYVIKSSNTNEEYVTLLKAEPLTTEEVNLYGIGHINRYTSSYKETVYDLNNYGLIAYYSSETCGFHRGEYTWSIISSGCTTDYMSSDIKYVVDAWKTVEAPAATDARLITKDEYIQLCEEKQVVDSGKQYTILQPQYNWMYNSNYKYWTSSTYNDSSDLVWVVDNEGGFEGAVIHFSDHAEYDRNAAVRPIIVLDKSYITD